MPAKECLFYKQFKGDAVKCIACQHYCIIKPGNFGICGVRKNIKGKLFLTVYNKVAAQNVDPIEKKPLYHFLPGSKAYSVGTIGCNFKCSFCQNYGISQENNAEMGITMSPEKIVKEALKNGCESIAYTYTEPAIAIEYWMEAMKIAKNKGLKNVLVTNGYISKEVLKKIHSLIDEMNIDLKAFNERFYQEICRAKLGPVLETIKLSKKSGIWIEITMLIIPGLNDSIKEIEKSAEFIKSVDENIPLHLSRYFPSYEMSNPMTSESFLRQALKVCKKHLKHVYLGNLECDSSTYCSNCRELLIKRDYEIINYLKKNECKKCKEKLKGVF
ncbi:MAG: AmmeMemoRadiSam system radical SAM enzyme [Candidatus Nanoarchaeia archaeon]|nr:AmmeMemoRadiSam system radical SAM enzyme [Candidatus Nanoarchaeia archaeon]